MTENKGAIFAEIVIGRNIVKDVGEAVQSIYRGLIGGRTTMAEKRMAMAIAEMQVELSDRAKDAGGNAVGNLKMDYEMVDGSATLTVMAHADALVIPKKNPKGAGKKGTSAVGNTYAIDLIPKSSVKLRSMKDIKKDNKILHKWRDSSAEMKALWKKYSATGKGGSGEVFIASRTFKTTKYQMKKGQRWNPIKPPYTTAGRQSQGTGCKQKSPNGRCCK